MNLTPSTNRVRRWSAPHNAVAILTALVLGALGGWSARSWLSAPKAVSRPVVVASAGSATLSATPLPSLAEDTGDPRQIPSIEERLQKLEATRVRLIGKRDELLRANAALDAARHQAEREAAVSQQHANFMENAFEKMSKGEVKPPATLDDMARLMGQSRRKMADFKRKWSGKAPDRGTPEATAYQAEMQATAADSAAIMKALMSPGGDGANSMISSLDSLSNDPAGTARFQTNTLAGALGLDATQSQQINGVLNSYYAQGYSGKLNEASRPDAGTEAWEQRRNVLAQQAYDAVANALPPAQRADFARTYGRDFLWDFTLPGL